ncbi:DEAD/DEAH box helicase [Okeania sp. SIO1I7]|uniref:DEAD/DEAH box helicase n=1 Tax=Okeania sp. SIO1I7 TaxID=2607772 RepID=UPI0013FAC835|nr:DEAD/DEAH box helicase [Okeania sp. SIO1I7]NET25524.1 DEAD/DEAH box helicase [Okeania sp. SIO1I7]
MAILHSFWLTENQQPSSLFIWGETWRRITEDDAGETGKIINNPYAITGNELLKLFQEKTDISLKNQKITTNKTLALPTKSLESSQKLYPLHSATNFSETTEKLYLYPWQIEGICLNPIQAIEFLRSFALGNIAESFIGADLRFWSHVARWNLDLLARCKFLPTIEQQSNEQNFAIWQPLLDSATDQNRLKNFTLQMPLACRTYQLDWQSPISLDSLENLQIIPKNNTSKLPNFRASQELLQDFLQKTIDAQIRQISSEISQTEISSLNPVIKQWLKSLSAKSNLKLPATKETQQIRKILDNWQSPLQQYQTTENQFITCFHLHSPSNNSKDWILEYSLQAIDDPEFIVDAKTIWKNPVASLNYQGRTIKFPQETLLSGLGLASRIYPTIEPSLQQATPQNCQLTPHQAYEFIKSGSWRFTDSGLGVILPPSLANREGWASRLGLSIRAQAPKIKKTERLGLKSLLNFQWELSIGGQKLTKAEFNQLVAKDSPLVEINGEWVELQPQDIRAAQNFFASRQDEMALSLEDALRLATGDTQVMEKLPVVNFEAGGQLQELLDTLTNNRSLEEIPTPKNFRGELRPYQARGVSWLTFLERWGLGACLADDMGLGKTIQTIAFLLNQQEQELLEAPTLLVCPTSVLGNWEREVKKFGPTLKVIVHHGDKRAKGKEFLKVVKDKHLVITSYALLYRDEKILQTIKWQAVIVDEAQNIKNPEAKQSQAARKLEASFRIGLTGTPVENRLSELWSILDFLNPGYLGKKQFFQRRFAIPIEKYGDTNSLQTLRSLVQPFILRRLKTDKDIIQDLPEKQENTIFCPLANEQAKLYQDIVETSLAEIEAADGIQRRGKILALLVKLKQLCNHPVLLQIKKGSRKKVEISDKNSGKLQRLFAMLEEIISETERAIIFTQFAEWGKVLQPYLQEKLGREISFLYGSTRKNQREEMVDRFQQDPQGPPVMILSLKAGGTGLNLTRANHVFHFDRWWNPAVENQATDRVFRIGQTRNVQVHKFVCTGTLEEKIHDLIESKKELAEQVVGAGEQWLTELDTDQLRNLLILDRNKVIEEE